MQERIEKILDQQVRPKLHKHNGDIRLAGFGNGVVWIELLGSCVGCPIADLDTRLFIESCLKASLPEIDKVELVQTTNTEMLDFAKKILHK